MEGQWWGQGSVAVSWQGSRNTMAALNVLPPYCLDRVREYALEIVIYIEKIIEKGCVYESNGSVSVYFVFGKFDSSSNHHYAQRKKLLRKLLRHCSYWRSWRCSQCSSELEGIRPRLCSVEEVQAWRAELAQWVGPGQARVAHRVLGDGQRRAGTLHGHTQQGTLTWGKEHVCCMVMIWS